MLLDVNGGNHAQVLVDGHRAGTDQATLVKAVNHLARTLAQLRRL